MTLTEERPVSPPGERAAPRRRPPWRLWLPAAVIAVYGVAAVAGPWLARYDPVATANIDRLRPPGARLTGGGTAWLGTDQVGRDLLAQIMQGARVSLLVGLATLLLAGVVGVALGVLAGYRGGPLDAAVMRLADVQMAFPSILLAVFIAAVLGPSVINVILTLAITRWVVFARVARAQTLAVRDREFVDASRTLGAGGWHIVRHCVLPALVAPVIVVGTVQLGMVIVAEASLSFLGLGTPAGTPSWGTTIAAGRDYLSSAWWIATVPGVALTLLVVCAGLLGDAIRDRLDPRLASR